MEAINNIHGRDPSLFVKEVPKNLICSVCHCVLTKPIDAPCCGNSFCNRCILKSLQNKQQCPVDRTPLSPDQLKQSSRSLITMLDELETICDFGKPASEKDSGTTCRWKGPWEQLSKHLQNDCDFAPVPCKYGCGKEMTKKTWEGHDKVCPEKPLQCQYCKSSIKSKQHQEHLASCNMLPVQCDQQCTASVPRGKLAIHKKDECPNSSIQCSLFPYGCTRQFKRSLLNEHMALCSADHTIMLTKYTNNLTGTFQNYSKSHDDKMKQLEEKFGKSIKQLEEKVLALSNKLEETNQKISKLEKLPAKLPTIPNAVESKRKVDNLSSTTEKCTVTVKRARKKSVPEEIVEEIVLPDFILDEE